MTETTNVFVVTETMNDGMYPEDSMSYGDDFVGVAVNEKAATQMVYRQIMRVLNDVQINPISPDVKLEEKGLTTRLLIKDYREYEWSIAPKGITEEHPLSGKFKKLLSKMRGDV